MMGVDILVPERIDLSAPLTQAQIYVLFGQRNGNKHDMCLHLALKASFHISLFFFLPCCGNVGSMCKNAQVSSSDLVEQSPYQAKLTVQQKLQNKLNILSQWNFEFLLSCIFWSILTHIFKFTQSEKYSAASAHQLNQKIIYFLCVFCSLMPRCQEKM